MMKEGRPDSALLESNPVSRDALSSPGSGAAGPEIEACLQERLAALSDGRLAQRQAQARRIMRDLGVTYGLYGAESGQDHIVPFDLFPRILDAAEWSELAQGVRQRLEIWNHFFKDIYDTQEVLKAGILPHELVYDDPHYQRSAAGLRVPEQVFVHVAGFDLARNAARRWCVVEDRVSNMTGLSYALQSRRVLNQVCPELFTGVDLRAIHAYPTMLLEHLRRFTPGMSSEPRVVLLSPGHYNQAYYDHSYLARLMGIPLVRGGDLIVLNGHVYLKTISGLEHIDVIYRRLDDAFIDPVEFREDSQLGVPGLMTCVRKGTVTVANAIGTGLGRNLAIAAYMPRLAKFYLNEPLQLPTVERWCCLDPDRCEEVLAHLEDYVVSSLSRRGDPQTWEARLLTQSEQEQLRERILSDPWNYVAEPVLPLDPLPACTDQGLEGRHAGLRVFALGGRQGEVFSCGLTRFATRADSKIISSGFGGGIKDTWILKSPEPESPRTSLVIASPQRRLRLGSRIAEGLFWMGRYFERAENTARILHVMQLVQNEDPSHQDPRYWTALWEALARATGHSAGFFKRGDRTKHQKLVSYIVLDVQNPSSVLHCLERCRVNAQSARESIPPEVWVLLNRLYQTLASASASPQWHDEKNLSEVLELLDSILQSMDALSGAALKSMLRDDAWHFWNMGICVERAVMTALAMRQVFLKRPEPAAEGFSEEAANLDVLLRMLSCQYAYRSLFQARPAWQNAAVMLLQDPQLPRSVLFCLEAVRNSLQAVFADSDRGNRETPLNQCARLIAEISFAELSAEQAASFSARPVKLHQWLDHLAAQLADLSTAIGDYYLHHQIFKILQ